MKTFFRVIDQIIGGISVLAGLYVGTIVVSDIQLILAAVLILGGLNLMKD